LNKEIEEKLKADPLLIKVGQHYPRLGLHDVPSGAGIQNLEVKNI
jgi:hypothetical protein